MSDSLNMAQLFGMVTQALSQKREDLNAADTYNHDHGDHVVEVFQLVEQVAKENPGLEPAEILARASDLLRQKPSGTAQAYAQTMAQGALQLKGKPLTAQTLPLLIQALLGSASGAASASTGTSQGGDLLGGLLGALTGGGQQPAQQPQPQQQPAGGDLLGGLLGALMGGGQAQQGAAAQGGGLSDGLGLDDLVRAGSAFLQASQSGQSTTEAALDALAAATGVGQTPHRAQSARVVVQALMQAAQMMSGK